MVLLEQCEHARQKWQVLSSAMEVTPSADNPVTVRMLDVLSRGAPVSCLCLDAAASPHTQALARRAGACARLRNII